MTIGLCWFQWPANCKQTQRADNNRPAHTKALSERHSMKKINLTKEEAARLQRLLEWRVEYITTNDVTPEQWQRQMWPIEMSAADVKEFKSKRANRLKKSATYQSILKKLGK